MSYESRPRLDPNRHLVLVTDLLKDCVLSCLEDLVRAEGSHKVIAATSLYGYNAGFAGASNIKARLGKDNDDPRTMAMVWAFAHNSFRRRPDVKLGPDWCAAFIRRCSHLAGGPEVCTLECTSVGKGMAESLGRDLDFIMTTCIAAQDDCCTQIFKPRSMAVASVLSELPSREWEEDLVPVSEEEALNYYRAYLSEFWMIVLRSSVDLIGEESTYDLLQERMYRLGVKWGPVLQREVSAELGHSIGVADMINSLNALLLQRGGEVVESNDAATREIDMCPFSSGLPVSCRLFEALVQGMITSVDAGHHFVYQRTMNEGASSCIWMLNKGTAPE
jgi:hypothetical protein